MKRLLFLLLSILLLAPLAHAGGYEDFSSFNLDWSGGNNSRLAFYSPLTSTSTILAPPRAYPGTAATFSRASAQYITDFEGVTRKVESGSVAVEGSRVVTNLLTYSKTPIPSDTWHTAVVNSATPFGNFSGCTGYIKRQ